MVVASTGLTGQGFADVGLYAVCPLNIPCTTPSPFSWALVGEKLAFLLLSIPVTFAALMFIEYRASPVGARDKFATYFPRGTCAVSVCVCASVHGCARSVCVCAVVAVLVPVRTGAYVCLDTWVNVVCRDDVPTCVLATGCVHFPRCTRYNHTGHAIRTRVTVIAD